MWRILRSTSPTILCVTIGRDNMRFSRHLARASLTRLINPSTPIWCCSLSMGMKSSQVITLYMELSQFTTSPLSISSVSLGFTGGRFL